MGFCFLNNVVVAAHEALSNKWARKVVILDWDIHHGNGTQDLTYDNPDILYISLHRGDDFYPGTGPPHETGDASKAPGTNVNIAFTNPHMTDVDYGAAFSEIVLPAINAFNPDLVIVSSGLDAAKGDLIGDNCLSPECYHLMTKSLCAVVEPECAVAVVLVSQRKRGARGEEMRGEAKRSARGEERRGARGVEREERRGARGEARRERRGARGSIRGMIAPSAIRQYSALSSRSSFNPLDSPLLAQAGAFGRWARHRC